MSSVCSYAVPPAVLWDLSSGLCCSGDRVTQSWMTSWPCSLLARVGFLMQNNEVKGRGYESRTARDS